MSTAITVACVLRSGGTYTVDYVQKLENAVASHMKIPYVFACVSNVSVSVSQGIVIESMDLIPGFWCKIKLFDIFTGPTLYLDLDTLIMKNLDDLSMTILEIPSTFWMLDPFKKSEKWASGVMGWNGDYSFIWRELTTSQVESFKWDQRYISHKLDEAGKSISAIQNVLCVASYKHHCQDGYPEEADVVCFHGSPRIHEVKQEWVARSWR